METVAAPKHPDLADYTAQIDLIRADFELLMTDLTDSQFAWAPNPGRWSIGQCLVHLNVTGELQLAAIRSAVDKLRSKQLTTDRPFRFGFLGRKFLQSLEPPVKQGFKAPSAFKPDRPQAPDYEKTRFLQLQDNIQRLIRDADGLDLCATKVPSPAARWLRFTPGVWLASIPAHERRHLWQMRQLLAEPDFPARR